MDEIKEKQISNVARLMKYYRQAKNMSQGDLGKAAGINLSTIKKYETGVRNPKYEQLEKIADALGISVDNFYESEITTVGELITIIKTLDEQLNMKITAEKDENGEYIPDTVKIAFKGKGINNALIEYMNLNKESDDELLNLLTSDKKIK